jgi:hypothetical protein
MHVTKTSEAQSKTEQLVSVGSGKTSRRKSILALSVFALGLNAAAAAYTMSPSDFALPNISGLVAELLPHERATTPIPDAVVAILTDIQASQESGGAVLEDHKSLLQQNGALLQKNGALLQQDAAKLDTILLQQDAAKQDAAKLDILRSSLTDERSDVKAISAQMSTLIAKIDALQNKFASDITASFPKERARTRLSELIHKRLARHPKPLGLISVREAPLSFPVAAPAPKGLKTQNRVQS